jgi:HD-like signal output (HDOD) protein
MSADQTEEKSEEKSGPTDHQECALIVRQDGKPQKLITNFLSVLLSYQYGFTPDIVPDFIRAGQAIRRLGESIRCVFVVQDQPINVNNTIPLLTRQGDAPLVILFPAELLATQRDECTEMDNVFLCAWEAAFGSQVFTLARLVEIAFAENGLTNLFDELGEDHALTARLEARLQNITTLPTLPAIVLKIMRLVKDPKTTMADLEQILSTDPAIVLKIMQVVNSPAFATAQRKQEWTLKDALVRLGMKEVGALAQQVAIVNSFARPQANKFDIQRFWEHSVGCATIAHRLYAEKLVAFEEEIDYDDYWITALLHDSGKLALGFFFWDWFERVTDQVKNSKNAFHQAEAQLSKAIDHQRIGEILMLKARMEPDIVEAVSQHDTPDEEPLPLTCLIHLANNLCKELGLSYLSEEKTTYSREVLRAMKLKREEVDALKEKLGESTVEEIRKQVEEYLKP